MRPRPIRVSSAGRRLLLLAAGAVVAAAPAAGACDICAVYTATEL